MRRSLRDNLPTSTENDVPETERSIARAMMVESFGPRTAGWLLWGHRQQLHAVGAVDFVVPERPNPVLGEKLRWFFIAMDFLRRRPGWTVVISTRKKKRTFRVTWIGWGSWGSLRTAKSS